jgi:hypothetical protein
MDLSLVEGERGREGRGGVSLEIESGGFRKLKLKETAVPCSR